MLSITKFKNFVKRLFRGSKKPSSTPASTANKDAHLVPVSPDMRVTNARDRGAASRAGLVRSKIAPNPRADTVAMAVGNGDSSASPDNTPARESTAGSQIGIENPTAGHNIGNNTEDATKSGSKTNGGAATSKPSLISTHHFKRAFKIVYSIAESLSLAGGPLKAACGVAVELLEWAETAQTNKEDIVYIANKVGHYMESISKRVQHRQLSSELKQFLEGLANKLKSVIQRLQAIESMSSLAEHYHADQNKDEIDRCKRDIELWLDHAQFEILLELATKEPVQSPAATTADSTQQQSAPRSPLLNANSNAPHPQNTTQYRQKQQPDDFYNTNGKGFF
ncbi:hypothetical protein AX16_006169 [Volvariella volvacea WC 439]|nr:hypothetical protein AX16_006169 [Volvariella volvacea WC 439]